MAVPPHHFDDQPRDPAPGGLLGELERRQDDVLAQLDDLDAKLSDVLKGLEPAAGKETRPGGFSTTGRGEASAGDAADPAPGWAESPEGGDAVDDVPMSADDWA